MSQAVSWKSGLYLHPMTCFSTAGSDFVRLTEVFRTSFDAVQFTLDRFQ